MKSDAILTNKILGIIISYIPHDERFYLRGVNRLFFDVICNIECDVEYNEDIPRLFDIYNNLYIVCVKNLSDKKYHNRVSQFIWSIEYRGDNKILWKIVNSKYIPLESHEYTNNLISRFMKLYDATCEPIGGIFTELNDSMKSAKDKLSAYIPSDLINLRILWCDNMYICQLPDTLVKLVALSCRYCAISEIPSNLVNLRYLICSGSSVRSIDLTENNNLIYLDCSRTYVNRIPETLSNLKHLDCSRTRVNRIPETLSNLKHLDCSRTRVNRIPETLSNLKHLICLNSSIKSIDLIENNNLTYLNCSGTLMNNISETLINLTYLDCSRTRINKIPETLSNLKHLNCSNTKVNKIPETLVNLIYLNCNNTYVRKIPNTLIMLEKLICETSDIPEELINLKNIRRRRHAMQQHMIKNISYDDI
jgi:Leucine-rich repeat (LRR) protein